MQYREDEEERAKKRLKEGSERRALSLVKMVVKFYLERLS